MTTKTGMWCLKYKNLPMQTLIYVNNHIGLHQSTHTSKALQYQATNLLTILKIKDIQEMRDTEQ